MSRPRDRLDAPTRKRAVMTAAMAAAMTAALVEGLSPCRRHRPEVATGESRVAQPRRCWRQLDLSACPEATMSSWNSQSQARLVASARG